MTKGAPGFVLVAVLLTAATAFAQSSDENQKGFLSSSLNFFQAGPGDEGKGTGAEAGRKDTGVPADEKKEAKPIKMEVKPTLYGLFDYFSRQGQPDTFDMTGAYIKLEGEYENHTLSVMANLAIADILTWAYIDLVPWVNHKEKFNIRVGTFAVPFGQQMQTFRYDLSSIDYSMIVQDLTQTIGMYDMGAMFHGNFKIQTGGINYALAILNGEFAGTADTNSAKSFATRLGFRFNPELEVGASYYGGKITDLDFSNEVYDTHLERTAFDLKWSPGQFKIRGEYISSAEDPENHNVEDLLNPGTPIFQQFERESTEGWWLDAGLFVWVNKKISDDHEKRGFELYFHYQGFEPPPNEDMRQKTSHASRTQFIYGIGINWHLSKYVKLQVLWQHLDFGRYVLGKYQGLEPGDQNDAVLVRLAVVVF